MRRERLYLKDIVSACDKLATYTKGHSFESFLADPLTFDAVVRNLQIIGEAVRVLPDSVRSIRSDIEWPQIVGMRHIVVHHYLDSMKR